MPSLVGLEYHLPPGWRKTLSFLSVRHAFFGRHAFSVRYALERQSLFARFRHEDIEEQKWF